MEIIYLDAARLSSRTQALELLGRTLALPEWWGRNLDALYDCLTDLDRPVRLTLDNREAMADTPFGRKLMRVLEDAARENPRLELVPAENDDSC